MSEEREYAVQKIIELHQLMGITWEQMPSFRATPLIPAGLTDEDFSTAVEEAKEYFKSISEQIGGVALPFEAWYSVETGTQKYWNAYIRGQKKWSSERKKTIEKQSQDIVNFLPNPKSKPNNIKDAVRKGLVYGNVQSGKTATIAGLMSMYASAGCRIIFVLSGVTNNLREQTQNRLVGDLRMNDGSCADWYLLTNETDKIRAHEKTLESIVQTKSNQIVVGVFKKLPAALSRLIKYCQQISDPSFWKNNQVLIIDDECDQYTPNVADRSEYMEYDEDTQEEYPRSRVNELIMELLNTVHRYCYVGFTATPFANVLNELPGEGSLYPEDFIYAINQPKNYYGAEKIFGDFDEPDGPALNVLNEIDQNDIKTLEINGNKIIPESLENAILYFIAATACKYKRGLSEEHSSMLIHTNLKTDVHTNIEKAVESYIESLNNDFGNSLLKLEGVWESEKSKNPPELLHEVFDGIDDTNYCLPSIKDMETEIRTVLHKLKIVVDNSRRRKEERLFYDPKKPSVFIVIGGNTLSRGLTIEGLVVSYFGRSSKNFDTLLQMGRWFGYRAKYEDLARLWIPKKLVIIFSFLCSVEKELREQMRQYSFDITPRDFALRIRTFPGLNITRKLAMQSAVSSGVNYSGHRPQTIFFKRNDEDWLNHNLDVTKAFVASLPSKPIQRKDAVVFYDVSSNRVINYIRSMYFHSRNRDCTQESLINFIENANKQNVLTTWNIAIVDRNDNKIELAPNCKVGMVNRSRVEEGQIVEDDAYIKILSDPDDIFYDLDNYSAQEKMTKQQKFKLRSDYYESKEKDEPGLVVIYVINKDSKPIKEGFVSKTGIKRVPMEAKQHIIGNSFVFPIVKNKDLYERMSIELPSIMESEEDYE